MLTNNYNDLLAIPDIPMLIIKNYLLPSGIIKFQRLYKNYFNLKKEGWEKIKCRDCNKSSWYHKRYPNKLSIVNCCASGCCYKFICRFGCKIKCSNGHINNTFNFDNYDEEDNFYCSECNIKIDYFRYWIGISEDEYNKR